MGEYSADHGVAGLKTTTQSIIVRKLSAYARKNKTRRALWEYDNIIRSLYLLDYIDSPPLRRNVQRALNRGRELPSAAPRGLLRQLRQAALQDGIRTAPLGGMQPVCLPTASSTTTRCSYLTCSTHKERLGDAAGAALLTHVSPVAWQHINLCGRYEFTKGPEPIHLSAIVEALAQAPVPEDLAR